MKWLSILIFAACSSSPPLHAFELTGAVPASGPELDAALFQTVDAELVPGHSVTWLDNGKVFDALIADIEKAKKSIDIDVYIWDPGEASKRVSAALIDKAKTGVKCRIVADAFGSPKFAKEILPALQAAGCEAHMFRPLPGESPLSRNHRKVVVIDHERAILGGFGINDSWLGDGVHGWRDTNVELEGPTVRLAQQAFAENWQEAGGALLPAEELVAPEPHGAMRVALVTSTASPVITRAERLTQLLIGAAHRRLWIVNAYFVPSKAVMELLKKQAAAGVDVRLLVPGSHDDVMAAKIAQRRLYPELKKAGIKVWEYQPSMIHSKTMVVDDKLSLVGSINLDPLSLNKLEEAAIVVEDAGFTDQLAERFAEDCAHGAPQ